MRVISCIRWGYPPIPESYRSGCRAVVPHPRPLPTLRLNPAVRSVFDFRYEDFTLENYDPWPAIKAPMSF